MASAPLPLVDYSDSDSASDSGPPAKIQKTATAAPPTPKLPPLPSRFHELYAVPPRVGHGNDDDPSLHGGRKRSIPHVQGNWPTHVFVEWHLTRAEFDSLDKFYTTAAGAAEPGLKLQSHLKSDLGSELPLHLSLSRPNVLRTEQREGFLETLKERYRKARVKPFTVEFTGFEWVGNHDSTRWFLVLKAAVAANSELPRLLDLTNRTFAAFKQPALYPKPEPIGKGNLTATGFHVSLAWSLTTPTKDVERSVWSVLETRGDRLVLSGTNVPIKMQVDNIKVKVGSIFHTVDLGVSSTQHEETTAENSRKRRMS